MYYYFEFRASVTFQNRNDPGNNGVRDIAADAHAENDDEKRLMSVVRDTQKVQLLINRLLLELGGRNEPSKSGPASIDRVRCLH